MCRGTGGLVLPWRHRPAGGPQLLPLTRGNANHGRPTDRVVSRTLAAAAAYMYIVRGTAQ
eukprot:COSAG01_NODE_67114_length_268_cov_0.603550_1_plen_59_part_01